MSTVADEASVIRNLNDSFRRTLSGGKTYFSAGVSDLGVEFSILALAAVRAFDAFLADNDPHGEHDFGSVMVANQKLFWKIDYYDRECRFGSDDPADPAKTCRVMTIMLAEEY